jgi:hypothetical protein
MRWLPHACLVRTYCKHAEAGRVGYQLSTTCTVTATCSCLCCLLCCAFSVTSLLLQRLLHMADTRSQSPRNPYHTGIIHSRAQYFNGQS